MSGITLAQAQARLTVYMDAEAAVLQGQSYSITTGGNVRQLTRANLAEIRSGIDYWSNKAAALESRASGRGRAVTVRPGW